MHDHQHKPSDATQRHQPDVRRQAESETSPATALNHPGTLTAEGLLDLQRTAGNAAVAGLVGQERSPVHEVVGSGGSSLDPPLRAEMEARLGHDFGDVRVHTGDKAHESAKSVGAHAYTVGSDIVFQRSAWDPGSPSGKITLAHELTHVVQQRSGPVDGTPMAGGIRVSDPADRFEREATATAERAMGEPVRPDVQRYVGEGGGSTAQADVAVQRQARDEGESDDDAGPG
jgi:hypothetical protein